MQPIPHRCLALCAAWRIFEPGDVSTCFTTVLSMNRGSELLAGNALYKSLQYNIIELYVGAALSGDSGSAFIGRTRSRFLPAGIILCERMRKQSESFKN